MAKQEQEDEQKLYESMKKQYEAELAAAEAEGLTADEAVKKTLESIGLSGGFTWPLPGYTYINSQYGMRVHPITGENKLHNGTDISGSDVNGKPIVAAYDGTVILAEYYYGYGNCVQISHGTGVVTYYAHMSAFAVKVGDVVKAGQTVGYVGSTGNSTGPHLHFTLYVGGTTVNPLDYLTIPTY